MHEGVLKSIRESKSKNRIFIEKVLSERLSVVLTVEPFFMGVNMPPLYMNLQIAAFIIHSERSDECIDFTMISNLYEICQNCEKSPCGGKTTGQSKLCTFFEILGWKVYRVPETANFLLSGGIKFSDLSEDQVDTFQRKSSQNLAVYTSQQLFNTLFNGVQHLNIVIDYFNFQKTRESTTLKC
ncbi:hypothetical protein AGLY_015442 [Aphis glycines]|uniref:Uncharacterized protein n=1 Tax=Aphis glycines TaxID=307491 RepID=A0A6G0T2R5_APHGL|nr:hypothetical protein AGLY_015442 [Aphis glycines]